jgi:hypothetical protein
MMTVLPAVTLARSHDVSPVEWPADIGEGIAPAGIATPARDP